MVFPDAFSIDTRYSLAQFSVSESSQWFFAFPQKKFETGLRFPLNFLHILMILQICIFAFLFRFSISSFTVNPTKALRTSRNDKSPIINLMNCCLVKEIWINFLSHWRISVKTRDKSSKNKEKKVFHFFKSSKCVMKWKLTINQKFVFSFNCFVLFNAVALINCDVFKLGYLTGSQRRAGDFEYERPG